jgi:hypothetical protein
MTKSKAQPTAHCCPIFALKVEDGLATAPPRQDRPAPSQ